MAHAKHVVICDQEFKDACKSAGLKRIWFRDVFENLTVLPPFTRIGARAYDFTSKVPESRSLRLSKDKLRRRNFCSLTLGGRGQTAVRKPTLLRTSQQN
jgi:hypothetical protein